VYCVGFFCASGRSKSDNHGKTNRPVGRQKDECRPGTIDFYKLTASTHAHNGSGLVTGTTVT
jgi:hypothetical protein